MSKKYVLEMNETQMKLLSQSLNLSARMLMGQMETLTSFFMMNKAREGVDPYENITYDDLEPLLRQIKAEVFPDEPWSGGPGIRSPKVADRVRVYFDLLQVVNAHIHDGPLSAWVSPHRVSEEPLAKMEVKDEP